MENKFRLLDLVEVAHFGRTIRGTVAARTLANPPFEYDVRTLNEEIIKGVPEEAITLIERSETGPDYCIQIPAHARPITAR